MDSTTPKDSLSKKINATQRLIQEAIVDIQNGTTCEEMTARMQRFIDDAQALWPEDEA